MTRLTPQEIKQVRSHAVPRHVAVVMDGNRRWAKRKAVQKVTQPWRGHWAGAEVLPNLVETAENLGIEVLTLYAFSTENWSRSKKEIETILTIFESSLKEQRQKMIDNGVRFHVIGDLTPFPSHLRDLVVEIRDATEDGEGLDLVCALNYGGRDEICRTAQRLIAAGVEEVTEELFASHLDTAPFGDPDLLIRTSGERRVSNFLLWQIAYCEIYIAEALWPDFTPRDLMNAVLDFQKRNRRLGK